MKYKTKARLDRIMGNVLMFLILLIAMLGIVIVFGRAIQSVTR